MSLFEDNEWRRRCFEKDHSMNRTLKKETFSGKWLSKMMLERIVGRSQR